MFNVEDCAITTPRDRLCNCIDSSAYSYRLTPYTAYGDYGDCCSIEEEPNRGIAAMPGSVENGTLVMKINPGKLLTEDDIHEIVGKTSFAFNDYGVDRIIRNGPATIVIWKDGTKTIVKRSKGEKDDIYVAFCAALAKKLYGNNSKIKRMLNEKTVYDTKKKGAK